jgi:SP family general alpha glucoside:H+ symporter-like MFS transporter
VPQVQYSLGAIGTIGSWFIMRQFGRRTLYLSGMAVMTALMCVIGGLGFAHPLQHASVSWTIGSLLIAFIFVYDFTVGPVCYTIVSEMSSTRLRAKTIVLSRNLYNIIGIVGNVISVCPHACERRVLTRRQRRTC